MVCRVVRRCGKSEVEVCCVFNCTAVVDVDKWHPLCPPTQHSLRGYVSVVKGWV